MQTLQPPSVPAETPLPWTPRKRAVFRFAAIYWVLLTLPYPISILPWTDWIDDRAIVWQREFGAWFGRTVLGIGGTLGTEFNGSGDRTTDYLFCLVAIILSLCGTIIWTAVDRNRKRFTTSAWLFRTSARYYLAWAMLAYGFAKVFRGQFQDPSVGTLVQTYGDSSPMHLLWTFMGHSATYTVFTGLVEVLAGALLLSRRTTALGAMLTVAVMANIFMLNLSYDVPVKLFSGHLLVLGGALLVPDAKRLINALVLGRAAEAPPLSARPNSIRWRRALVAGKLVVVALLLHSTGYDSYTHFRDRQNDPPPALHGLYEVSSFRRGGVDAPPLLTDAKRWRSAHVTKWSSFVATYMDGSTRRYRLVHDAAAQTISLTEHGADVKQTFTLSAVPTGSETLRITGTLHDEVLDVELQRRDVSEMLLNNRGFHWINEFPYNR